MSIRFATIAAVAALAFTAFAPATAEAGFTKRSHKAPAARSSSCPITAMLQAKRERLAKRVDRVRTHHVRSERPARTARVARRAPTK